MLKEKFTGYVLSGGKSSRMGEDKAFLKIGEKTFIENAVETLKPNCENVKIVLNKSQIHFIEKLPGNISYIFDRFENRGALGGIHAAFSDCKTGFAIILAVDLPLVTTGAIEKLCETISTYENFSAIVPRQTDGKFQPLCAVYRIKNCLPKAEEILSKTKNASVKDMLETIKMKIVEEKTLSENRNLFFNINRRKEYEHILF